MKFVFHLITKYPISCLLIAVIWYLSLCDIPETKLSNIRYIDKWTHTAMYFGTCMIIWVEYLRRHSTVSWHKILLLAWLAPLLMSGLLEILQANCTNGLRNGEWLDFIANSIIPRKSGRSNVSSSLPNSTSAITTPSLLP